MKVAGKAIAVTGGGNGIGRQVVLELLRRGAWVAAADIRPGSLAETVELAGVSDGRLLTFELDVTDREATAGLPAKIIAGFGQVDGLVNVAGIIQPFVNLIDLGYDVIERVINVNLYGTINMNKAFLPILIERPVAHIANVSSMGGFLPVPGQTVYGASKAAVKLLTEGLYAELLDTNVGVTVVMPGGVATDITENSGVEIPAAAAAQNGPNLPITTPEDAARIIIDGIEDDQLHVYVGKDSRMMNLASRIAPRRATHLIQRQMKKLLE